MHDYQHRVPQSPTEKKYAFLDQSSWVYYDALMDKQSERDPLSNEVIGAAIEVHRALGPGLLEKAYCTCLAHELSLRGIRFSIEVPVPIEYKACKLATAFRLDMLIEDELITELKSSNTIEKIHQAQLLTYLRLANLQKGLIINFNVTSLRKGIQRLVR